MYPNLAKGMDSKVLIKVLGLLLNKISKRQSDIIFLILLIIAFRAYVYLEIPFLYALIMTVGKIAWYFVEFYNLDLAWGRLKTKFDYHLSRMIPQKSLLLKKEEITNRLHHLDSCRGIACLFVAIDHFLSGAWTDDSFINRVSRGPFRIFISTGGQDVQFFLVLSGYVLAMIYWTPKRSSDLYKMLMGRATRFYPLHWVLVVFALSIVHYWSIQYEPNQAKIPEFSDVMRCLTLTENWNLYGDPRFAQHEIACNTVAWSLSVEWLVNIVMFICIRYLPTFLCLPIFELITYVSWYGGGANPGNLVGGNSNHSIFFAFFLGVFTYKFTAWAKIRHHFIQIFFDIATLAHLRNMYVYFDNEYAGDNFWGQYEAIKYTIAWRSCIFIYLLENSFLVKKFLSLSPFTFLGKISFAFYLSHVNLLRFYRILNKKGWAKLNGEFEMLMTMTVFVLFATFLHYKIEIPAKQHLDVVWKVSKPKPETKKGYEPVEELPLHKEL